MYNSSTKARVLTFKHFSRKGYALLSCLHREVRIGVLGVATLAAATPRLMAAPLVVAEGGAVTSHEITAPADTLALGEARVTASRAPLAAAVAARQVTVLTRADLESAGVQTLQDALKLIAGIDVRQRGAFGIQSDISIDGGTHDQLTWLLNGVPMVNPQTGHLAADFPVNISDIDRIEVLEGAASRVMGSQAFSGAINIVTRRAEASPRIEARLEGGSKGTFRGEARGALRFSPRWAATLSGGGQRSDGLVANGGFRTGKGFATLSYDAPDIRIDLQGGVTSQDFGANTFYSAAYPDQWEATRRYLASARAETKGRVRLTPQLSWVRSLDHFQLIRDSKTGENFHRGDVFTAALGGWFPWWGGRTAFGGELREECLYSTNLGLPLAEDRYVGIPKERGRYYTHRAERTNLSYYLEHNIVWRKWTLSAGVMAERSSATADQFRFYPGVDLSYRPAPHAKLYASYNRSLRLPSFTELWYKSPTQEGNVGLQPEEVRTLRLGADLSGRYVRLRLKGHLQRGTDMIDWVMYSPDDRYHATAFSLDGCGLGADLTADLKGWWGRRQPFETLALSYAWLAKERRKGEAYYKSNYALEYLRHKFVARLSHRIVSRLHADWSLRVQQREGGFLVYENLKPTGGVRPYGTHALLDLRLSWTATRWSLYADLSNLTNHTYYDQGNVRQPGLAVLCGGTFRW